MPELCFADHYVVHLRQVATRFPFCQGVIIPVSDITALSPIGMSLLMAGKRAELWGKWRQDWIVSGQFALAGSERVCSVVKNSPASQDPVGARPTTVVG